MEPKKPYTIEQVACICHMANLALCEANGDYSQKPWDSAEQWQKDSAINGVQFQLANPDAPASASHDNWMREKTDAGWVYGHTKDPDNKRHPCIIPFDRLPPNQQAKDHLFKNVVSALAPFIDRS